MSKGQHGCIVYSRRKKLGRYPSSSFKGGLVFYCFDGTQEYSVFYQLCFEYCCENLFLEMIKGCVQTCRSRRSLPLWRRVHRVGRRSIPAWASPGHPEGPLRTGNTPEGRGDGSASAHLLLEGWTPTSGRRSGAPAPSGSGAAPLGCLQPPAIPAAPREREWNLFSSDSHLSPPSDT